MSDIAIKVENLSKRYRIGLKDEMPDTLVGAVTRAVRQPLRNLRRLRRLTSFRDNDQPPERSNVQPSKRATAKPRSNDGVSQSSNSPAVRTDIDGDTVWALKDVSFEVERGEVVGIIGRNGAGKSTLLKVLSRITEPTEGRAVINGRVGSLLEVGTGFHPELTGRENIYLNGAILGMTKDEIDRKFDEIVDFSGVEKFIDTPVKRYSSGMRVRLGFSVAAHLDPEILLIDEVLAVGDMSFQRKCIGKMNDVAKSGRTVLFVSHNMSMISSLCSRCMLLREGNLALMGNTEAMVEKYKAASSPNLNVPLSKRDDRRGSGDLRFTKLRVLGDNPEAGSKPGYVSSCEPAKFVVGYSSTNGEPVRNLDVAVRISSVYGDPLVTFNSRFQDERFSTLSAQGQLICEISSLPLLHGTYRIDLWAGIRGVTADYIEGAGKLEVMENDVFGTGRLPKRKKHGSFIVPFSWNLKDSEWGVYRTWGGTRPNIKIMVSFLEFKPDSRKEAVFQCLVSEKVYAEWMVICRSCSLLLKTPPRWQL